MKDNDYIAAQRLLQNTGLSPLEAVKLTQEAADICGWGVNRIRDAIQLGTRELEKRKNSISFLDAVRVSLESKSHRRPRTLLDIRQLMERLLKYNPEFARSPLMVISQEDCQNALDRAFFTPRQQFKARTVMGGIFSVARKRGWCSENPIDFLDVPVLQEKEIRTLTVKEIKDLLYFSQALEEGACAAAAGLMIFAGIRPKEVERLKWKDICFSEKVISLRPNHTKTGGTRHVTVLPVLEKWLNYCRSRQKSEANAWVCPPNWRSKWKRIRIASGWQTMGPKAWQEDCLRHTYASYHAKYFGNYPLLQAEMGHGSTSLLRTRYLNMAGVTQASAVNFWNIELDDQWE